MKDLIKTRSIKHKIKDFFTNDDKKHVLVVGKNNIIQVADLKRSNKIKFHIYGDNNKIIINTKSRFISDIRIGSKGRFCNNCKIIIGENSTSEGSTIRMQECNLELCIGTDSMLSNDIQIFCSDIHTIYDNENNVINRGKNLIIGNHVWIGTGVNIAKNSIIGDNCIVGMKSVVAGKFEEPNCVIAGNPARVVKRNVNWDRLPIPSFDKKRTETDNI